MLRDYTTYLLKAQLTSLSERKVQRLVRVIDKNLLRAFDVQDRFEVAHILPGMRKRRFGAKFGLTARGLDHSASLSWGEVVSRVKSDMHFKTEAETVTMIEAYLKAHLSVMSATARLRFAQACPDELLRVYLRVLNT